MSGTNIGLMTSYLCQKTYPSKCHCTQLITTASMYVHPRAEQLLFNRVKSHYHKQWKEPWVPLRGRLQATQVQHCRKEWGYFTEGTHGVMCLPSASHLYQTLPRGMFTTTLLKRITHLWLSWPVHSSRFSPQTHGGIPTDRRVTAESRPY